MIAADQDDVRRQHRRQVAVADVPGDAHQPARRRAGDAGEWLGRGGDGDEAPVVELQHVAAAEPRRLLEVEQELGAALRRVMTMRRRWRWSKSSTTLSTTVLTMAVERWTSMARSMGTLARAFAALPCE